MKVTKQKDSLKTARKTATQQPYVPSEVEDEEEDLDELADPELRKKIEDALRVNGIQPATGDSDSESEEELMDDEQMMAIDEQLAAVFKARADERRLGKGWCISPLISFM